MTTTPLLTRDRPDIGRDRPVSTAAEVTFGVEEELLLLDPVTGRPVPAAPELLELLAGEPGLHAELMRFQFEIATPVCTTLAQLRDELMRLRRLAGAGAEALGCRLVASGVSPYGTPGLTALTDNARYQELARRYPRLTAGFGTCGCHVHVGVPSRDAGVHVLARLRPWLASLLAISANSPVHGGRDTGWASTRHLMVTRWPTARLPYVWPDASAYEATVRHLIGHGAALDESNVYFLARLSPRYPTVEIRVADVCPDIDTALLLAALARALVVTALDETTAQRAAPDTSARALLPGLTAAARAGLAAAGVDPFTGEPALQRDLLGRLLEHVGRALSTSGDLDHVAGLLMLLTRRGTGADRQRRLWRQRSNDAAFVAALADNTLADPVPPIDQPPGWHLREAGRTSDTTRTNRDTIQVDRCFPGRGPHPPGSSSSSRCS